MLFPQTLTTAAAKSVATGATAHGVTTADYAALGELHDQVFGPGALTRTAYRVREGTSLKHTPFCRVLRDPRGQTIAFIRFAFICIGQRDNAVMLGPLAVGAAHANQGHARRLIMDGLDAAAAAGVRLAVLVGDVPYYGKLGFVPIPVGQITMPGPVDPSRLLAFELVPRALAEYRGMIGVCSASERST
jgi:predicted N-acetyltransferase YhbS